jgi:hypothetical protein
MRFMVVVPMPVAAVLVMVVRVAVLIIHRCPLDYKKSSFCLIPIRRNQEADQLRFSQIAEDAE